MPNLTKAKGTEFGQGHWTKLGTGGQELGTKLLVRFNRCHGAWYPRCNKFGTVGDLDQGRETRSVQDSFRHCFRRSGRIRCGHLKIARKMDGLLLKWQFFLGDLSGPAVGGQELGTGGQELGGRLRAVQTLSPWP